MKNKIKIALFLCILLVLFAGCSTGGTPSEKLQQEPVISGGESKTAGAEIAMLVTDTMRESAQGQAAWGAVNRFAGENALTSAQYKTEEDNEESALATLELAVKGGARLVVVLGEKMADVMEQAPLRHPDVDFLYIDAGREISGQKNVAEIRIAYEQGGWLAGYSAVYEGIYNLTFVEENTLKSKQYAAGFLLGIEQAAKDLNLAKGKLQVNTLKGQENEKTDWRSLAEESFAKGTQIIFSNAIVAQKEIQQAARTSNAQIIAIVESPLANKEIKYNLVTDMRSVIYDSMEAWHKGNLASRSLEWVNVGNGGIYLVFENNSAGQIPEKQYQQLVANFEKIDFVEQLQKTADTMVASEQNLLENLPFLNPSTVQNGFVAEKNTSSAETGQSESPAPTDIQGTDDTAGQSTGTNPEQTGNPSAEEEQNKDKPVAQEETILAP